MASHTQNALDLTSRLSIDDMNEQNDLYWALVKYIENVQESIKQIDGVSSSVLRVLDEIPLEAKSNADISWKGFKGMRDVLAHQVDSINPEIVWKVATVELPTLNLLLSNLRMKEGYWHASVEMGIQFRTDDLLTLPSFAIEGRFVPGNAIVVLYFDDNGQAQCYRIGYTDSTTLNFSSTVPNKSVTVYGRRRDG